mmetsp:Transcript_1880/g.8335  ORF Transcript_1880/g.8335 Transcript_1880/m.8335 type:complete len:314 (-) Transcript_1880:59-1000(-)
MHTATSAQSATSARTALVRSLSITSSAWVRSRSVRIAPCPAAVDSEVFTDASLPAESSLSSRRLLPPRPKPRRSRSGDGTIAAASSASSSFFRKPREWYSRLARVSRCAHRHSVSIETLMVNTYVASSATDVQRSIFLRLRASRMRPILAAQLSCSAKLYTSCASCEAMLSRLAKAAAEASAASGVRFPAGAILCLDAISPARRSALSSLRLPRNFPSFRYLRVMPVLLSSFRSLVPVTELGSSARMLYAAIAETYRISFSVLSSPSLCLRNATEWSSASPPIPERLLLTSADGSESALSAGYARGRDAKHRL